MSSPPRVRVGVASTIRRARHKFCAGRCRRKECSMRIDVLDHLVLTVADLGRTRDFYERVLGMEPVVFGERRHALAFGAQKINLHEAGREFEPKAAAPTPGSADLCFWTQTQLDGVIEHLQEAEIVVEQGPVRRTGARSSRAFSSACSASFTSSVCRATVVSPNITMSWSMIGYVACSTIRLGSLGKSALIASATPLPTSASKKRSGESPCVEGSRVTANSAETPASVMIREPPPRSIAAAIARATTVPIWSGPVPIASAMRSATASPHATPKTSSAALLPDREAERDDSRYGREEW